MASQVAVGGSLLGAGAIGVGGAYLAGAFGGEEVLGSEPTVRVILHQDDGFNTDYTDNNFIGKKYSKYLVAPIGSKGAEGSKTNNREWWAWSYARWQKDSKPQDNDLSTEFKGGSKVGSAFSDASDSSTALNKVCEAVYKKNKSEITSSGTSPDNQAKLKRDLFKYCSILGEVKTISEVGKTYGNSTKGQVDANKKTFIAIKGNDKFWEERNKEFYATSGDKSNSSATEGSKFKTEPQTTTKPNVRDICEKAYESSTSDTTNYPVADVSKFCTL
ncbi:hypothetical protein [Candidatus Mycoplasma haematohominis]|uniref:Uncharacterized protein n=1 Tax=Candidatus Mycoplasma haematohominis TaxID=1494318 RepID=A0A478FSS5_9MOLU|nr:hypothetical protein [Candidatus Mycoplasma haemohominis]GCE63050.1 hypothetical protein MHSWG343_00280 [Candidatus Mycoplasma haemohominis]